MAHFIPGSKEPKRPEIEPNLTRWLEALPLPDLPGRIEQWVRSLPAPRNRLHAPSPMREADHLILDGFRQAGWDAELQPFTFDDVNGYADYGTFGPSPYTHLEGMNIVATKEGSKSREAVVVLGHHDTVRDSPGANDNTASVAVILELARVIAPYQFAKSIILAATDMEELGFFGSRALVASLGRAKPVKCAINFETMGYTSQEPNSQFLPPGLGIIYSSQVKKIQARGYRGDFTIVIYNGTASGCAAYFAAGLARLAGAAAPILLRDPNDLPVTGALLGRTVPFVRQFARSDHVPFWEAGIPAIQITDSANFRYTHYHRQSDTAEKLDYMRLAHIAGATAFTLASQAGLILPD